MARVEFLMKVHEMLQSYAKSNRYYTYMLIFTRSENL